MAMAQLKSNVMINVLCVAPSIYITLKTNNAMRDAKRSLLSESRSVSSNLIILLSRCQDICYFFHLHVCHTEIEEEDAENILLISQVANTSSR